MRAAAVAGHNNNEKTHVQNEVLYILEWDETVFILLSAILLRIIDFELRWWQGCKPFILLLFFLFQGEQHVFNPWKTAFRNYTRVVSAVYTE